MSIHASGHDSSLIEVEVAAVSQFARDIKLIEIRRRDGKALPPAEAGAHIDVHLPGNIVRQYSLLNPNEFPLSYRLGVKRDPESRGGSRHICDALQPGDLIQISAPRNHFPLSGAADHSVLIAGGIGITPIWAMLQALSDSHRSWELHYACRAKPDALFLTELNALEQARLHFDDDEGRFLDIGSIVTAAPAGAHFYCCGPAAMLDAFAKATAGLLNENVHVEYFSANVPKDLNGGFTVELATSGLQFVIPAGRSILSVLLEAGIDIPYSCEQGICGTCEVRVLSGIPNHRDAILSEDDRNSNQFMMVCCSGSKTDRLVLDI